MTLTTREKLILRGILADREDFASRTLQYGRRDAAGLRERGLIEDARVGEVVGDPARWLGLSMTASLRVSVSRIYAALHRKGLVVRRSLHGDTRRTDRLSLTAAGEKLARELAATDITHPRDLPEACSASGESAGDPSEARD